MTLTTGQRITLLTIDSIMALTHRYELEVRSLTDPKPVGYQGGKLRVAVVRQRGKRKDIYLDLAYEDILLDGWGLPFQTDSEAGGVFSGNACFNLVGDPGTIRHLIADAAVRPVPDSAKAKIIVARGPRTTCDDSGLELLYPDIETHHAVINRFKDAQGAQAH